jgi:hypothetical protein
MLFDILKACEGGKTMCAQKYTMFPPAGDCNEPLTAHIVKDEFIFVQLAPMEAMRNGESDGKLKMPKDAIAPERVADLHRRYPEIRYEVFGKGAGIWLQQWREPIPPAPSEYPSVPLTEVTIDDISSFIAKPEVKVEDGGEGKQVTLEEENIQDLLNGQPTIARIRSDNNAGEYPAIARIVPSIHRTSARSPVVVNNVNELLASRSLIINGKPVQANLTPVNVAELAQGGMTVLYVNLGDTPSPVFVVNRQFCTMFTGVEPAINGTIQTTLARSALSASASQGMGWQKPLPGRLLSEPDTLAAISNATFFTDGTLALYLPYRVTWELLGYTRGELLNTISLAPEETTTIEITTWDRRREEAETSASFETQSTSESSFNAKLTAEAVNDLSHKHDWGLNVHGDVSIPIQTAKVGIGGAWNDSQGIQDTHKGSVTLVLEGLTKATSQLKTTRQTKVSQSRETGFDRRNIRQIKNSNMCHTLDLHYFEILSSYQVTMVPLVNEARVCLLVQNPIRDPIEPRFLLTYESELRRALLAPEHDDGFAAARMLAALSHVHGYECILHCPEPCPCDQTAPVVGTGTSPTAIDPVAEATEVVANSATSVRERIKLLNDADVYRDHVTDGSHTPISGICALARDVFGSHPQVEWDAAIDEWRRWLFREIHLKRHATGFWSECVRYQKDNDNTPARLELLLKAGEVGWASGLNQAVAAILSSIQLTGIAGSLSIACRLNLKPLLDHAGFDDAGLDGAMKQASNALESYNTAKASATSSQVVKDAETIGKEIVNSDETGTDSSSWPYKPKNLAEARVAQDALLAHITTHECYYRQAVWASLGVDDRLLILRLMNDLPRTVEPRVVGFLADDCALPLRLDQYPEIAAWLDQNVVHNQGLLADPTTFTVTLPTGGVKVETRLGQCSTCEDFIENHRELDLAQKGAEVDLVKERVAQEKLETKRYQARLDATPPMLDDPDPSEKDPTVRVVLEKP